MSNEHSVWRLSEIGKGATALKQHREAVPTPAPGQYLVRIHSVSLNYRDVAIVKGNYPVPNIVNGFVVCSDMAGEIVSAGERATQFQVGDKVTSIFDQERIYGDNITGNVLGGPLEGCLQEYRCFDEITLLKAPKYLSYDEVATLPIAAVTAWNALYGGKRLVPGQTVLLQGTGGVSLFGLLIASKAGARVIITSSSDDKLEFAKKLGASHTINYKRTPDWAAEVHKLTNGVGAHHILDNVGVNGLEQCFKAVALGGVISTIGFLGGQAQAWPNLALLKYRGASLRGIVVGSKQQFEEVLQFAETNEIHPHIDRVFSFEQAVEALQYLESGQHFGKVVIRVVPG